VASPSYTGRCGILLASFNVFGTTTNHPPTVSWIEDQAISTGTGFAQVYFRA
jgi:hypothetical protein